MKIEITRSSIIGVGEITPPGGEAVDLGDASRSGYVTKPLIAKAGEIVDVAKDIATRLIGLGSAKLATKKAV